MPKKSLSASEYDTDINIKKLPKLLAAVYQLIIISLNPADIKINQKQI